MTKKRYRKTEVSPNFVCTGHLCNYFGHFNWSFYPELGESLKPLGDAFIKIVKMIIAPVIFLTVVTGIASMTNMSRVGRVTGKAMLYFLTSQAWR